jgi:uncharacterized membrane protein YdjX (TVP38/TMEM64 family)
LEEERLRDSYVVKKYKKQIILFSIVVVVILLVRLSGAGSYLTVENLKKNKELLQHFIDARYLLSVALYVAVYILTVTFSLPGATVLTLAGGFLFHLFPGILYVNVAATVGATLGFLFARYILGNSIQEKYAPQLERFNHELAENGHLYLLTLRLIPVFPFFLINLLAGLTRVGLKTFFWTTLVGILPGSFVYCFAGSQLNTIESVEDVFSANIIAAFLALALFALLPVMLKKLRTRLPRTTDR